MLTSAYVESKWIDLCTKQNISIREYIVEDTGIKTPYGAVLLALDSSLRRHLFVPVKSLKKVFEDKKSSGVHIVPRQLEDGPKLFYYMDIVCRKDHLYELFSVVVSEMLNETVKNPEEACKACRLVLERWRELLGREKTPLLSTEAMAGLFSELWHLRKLLNTVSCNIECWTGPEKSRHDFAGPQAALEVKSTLSRQGRCFHVNGHQQLETPNEAPLYLAAVKLEKTIQSGESIPDIIKDILATGCDQQLLHTKLHKIGYDIHYAEIYREILFIVKENRMYVVDDDFPRITSQSFKKGVLPPGIRSLSYQIDLTNEPPCPLPEKEHSLIYKKLAGTADT